MSCHLRWYRRGDLKMKGRVKRDEGDNEMVSYQEDRPQGRLSWSCIIIPTRRSGNASVSQLMLKRIFFGERKPAEDLSTPSPPIDFRDLTQKSYFSEAELRVLYQRYNGLVGEDGTLSDEDFYSQPEVANCRLIVLAVEMIHTAEHSSGLSFSDYVSLLSKFRYD